MEMKMSKLITFTPDLNLSVKDNMLAYISMCKNNLTVFSDNTFNFQENVWDVSDKVMNPGQTNRSSWVFATYEDSNKGGTRTHKNVDAMREPFLSFAKAYMRYQFTLKRFSDRSKLQMLRSLHDALLMSTHSTDPSKINGHVLDETLTLLGKRYTQEVAYRLAGHLQKLGKFMTQKRLIHASIDWKHSIKRPSDGERVGKKADLDRENKLPSEAALDALAEIFNITDNAADQVSTSMAALMISNPSRVNELFYLRHDSEVHDKDKDGALAYGLRWYSAKGGDPDVKWVLNSFHDTTKKAFRLLIKHTNEARELAKWYERNPNRIYLPPELEYLRSKAEITLNEASQVIWGLGESGIGSIHSWLNTHKVPYQAIKLPRIGKKGGSTSHTTLLFDTLQKTLLAMLPKHFPYIDQNKTLKCSESLLLTKINQLKKNKRAFAYVIAPIAYSYLHDRLGAKRSLFDDYGFVEEDGSRIKLTSHMFRHYLNTLMQKSGKLSQLDISRWSGRKDVKQNSVYNHSSPKELLEMASKAMGDRSILSKASNGLPRIKRVLIRRDEFNILKHPAVHVTEIGYCIQDFAVMPCQLHMDCYNCTKAVCVKGEQSNEKIFKDREILTKQLDYAIKAMEEGDYGTDRWVEHYGPKLDRLNLLCTVLSDCEIPNGTIITFNESPAASALEIAERRRCEVLGITYNDNKENEPLITLRFPGNKDEQ